MEGEKKLVKSVEILTRLQPTEPEFEDEEQTPRRMTPFMVLAIVLIPVGFFVLIFFNSIAERIFLLLNP